MKAINECHLPDAVATALLLRHCVGVTEVTNYNIFLAFLNNRTPINAQVVYHNFNIYGLLMFLFKTRNILFSN
jgi:hypothetical protein